MTVTDERTRRGAGGARGGVGLGHLVRAEWIKLRSVRGWTMTLLSAGGLTVLVSLLGATGSSTDANQHWDSPIGPDGRPVTDQFHFVHRPLSGDGSVTARVRSLTGHEQPGQEWAKAGIMIKDGVREGSPYAAMMVTPGHGVRLQANFTTDLAGGPDAAPRWLRLVRAGGTVTGFESADGVTWSKVGGADVRALPPTVEVGLFVASPPAHRSERQFGATSTGSFPTAATATFDNVRVEPARSGPAQAGSATGWRGQDVGDPQPGEDSEAGGTVTVTGSGDIVPDPPDDDPVRLSLTGAFVGLMAIVVPAVLFLTAEYRRGMIRTTFAAEPRRGRVLAAKAIVIGGAAFGVGLVASVASFLLARPVLRANGFAPPAYPDASLFDGPVLRAVIGTAAVLGLIAVFSLGLAAIARRTAGAITVAILLIVVPQFLATALPIPAGQWLLRILPAAGFSIQQTTPRYAHAPSLCLPEDGCFVANPWVGFAVLTAYAAAALVLALWAQRRRDA